MAPPSATTGLWRCLLCALHQETGHRPHRIPADQATFIARSPPLRNLTKESHWFQNFTAP